MQKLPIKQDNTTQSPVGMSVGYVCKQAESEQGNICRLRLVSVGVWWRCTFFLSAGTLNGSANCLSHFLIWLPPALYPSTLCLLCMFIKNVLNCERPAKCIPLTEDRLKKKNKYLQGLSFTCFLNWLSQNNQTSQCFLWSWFCTYRVTGECKMKMVACWSRQWLLRMAEELCAWFPHLPRQGIIYRLINTWPTIWPNRSWQNRKVISELPDQGNALC